MSVGSVGVVVTGGPSGWSRAARDRDPIEPALQAMLESERHVKILRAGRDATRAALETGARKVTGPWDCLLMRQHEQQYQNKDVSRVLSDVTVPIALSSDLADMYPHRDARKAVSVEFVTASFIGLPRSDRNRIENQWNFTAFGPERPIHQAGVHGRLKEEMVQIERERPRWAMQSATVSNPAQPSL